MPPLKTLLQPGYPWRFLKSRIQRFLLSKYPNLRGAAFFPPGHFYSPLLEIEPLTRGTVFVPHDGPEAWEHVDLRAEEQHDLYAWLLSLPPLAFPVQPEQGFRYYSGNDWFPLADAFLLSGLMRSAKPSRILEVGAGFSTAVMLDTCDHAGLTPAITCIEPFPERLSTLIRESDWPRLTVLNKPVQEVPLETFDTLEAADFLFIDSSHVAKAGSDVSHLLLRVLPRLKPGVWVHVHDMFYPQSYPREWIMEGRAWNESLFLRAFLIGNTGYVVRAFHDWARQSLPSELWSAQPEVRRSTGSSFWMQRADSGQHQ